MRHCRIKRWELATESGQLPLVALLYLTFCSSFSISRARIRRGPRTAYSIFRRLMKTLSSVRTLLPGGPVAMLRRNVLSEAGRWTTDSTAVRRVNILPPDVPGPAEVVSCSHVLGRLLAITAFHQRACGIMSPVGPPSLPRTQFYQLPDCFR